jgi:hypothetical protein
LTCDANALGDTCHDTGENVVYYCDGSAWILILSEDAFDTCAEYAAIWDDETGICGTTYGAVLSKNPVLENVTIQDSNEATNWNLEVDTNNNLLIDPSSTGWVGFNHPDVQNLAEGYVSIFYSGGGPQLALNHSTTEFAKFQVGAASAFTFSAGPITFDSGSATLSLGPTNEWDATSAIDLKSGVGNSTMISFYDNTDDVLLDITQTATGAPPANRVTTLYDSDLTLAASGIGKTLEIEKGVGTHNGEIGEIISLSTQNHIWMSRGWGNIDENNTADNANWQIAGSRNALALIGQRPDVTITCNTGDYTINDCERLFDAGDYATINDVDDNSPDPTTATAIIEITDASGLDQMHVWNDALLDGTNPIYTGIDNFYWGAMWRGEGKVFPADATIEAKFDNNEDGDGCGLSCQYFTIGSTANVDSTSTLDAHLEFSDPSGCTATGTHTGAGPDDAVLSDTNQAFWDVDEWIGWDLTNQTVDPGTSSEITDNDGSTITTTSSLSWDNGDVYTITGPPNIGDYLCIRDPYKIYAIKITLTDWRDTEVCPGDSTCDDAFLTEMFIGQGKEWLYPYYLPRYDPEDRWPMVDEINWVDTDGTFYGINFNTSTDEFDADAPWSSSSIEDAYLLNTGDVGTGVYDFGGATSFEIVNGTGPTVDAAGEVAIDTTDGQLVYHDGTAKRVIPYEFTVCKVVENLKAGDDDMPLYSPQDNITLVKAWCLCTGTCTTEADLSLEANIGGDDVGGTIDCEDETAGDSATTLTSDNTVDALKLIRFDVDNTPDPESDTYTVCFVYTVDAQ